MTITLLELMQDYVRDTKNSEIYTKDGKKYKWSGWADEQATKVKLEEIEG